MSEIDKTSITSEKDRGYEASDVPATVAPADQTMETILKRLPTQYREELMKQYDLPQDKVSILTVLRYATPLEFGMQIVGALMAIAGGISSSKTFSADRVFVYRCCLAAYDYFIGKFDKLVWWICLSWNAEFDSSCYHSRVRFPSICAFFAIPSIC